MRLTSPYTLMGVIVAGITLVILFSSNPKPVYCAQAFAQREQAVVMFGTSWCRYCGKARQYFDENKIAYCEYDIEASDESEASYRALGGDGVPLILVGETRIIGFNESSLHYALRQRHLMP
jgi:glutaredoxin